MRFGWNFGFVVYLDTCAPNIDCAARTFIELVGGEPEGLDSAMPPDMAAWLREWLAQLMSLTQMGALRPALYHPPARHPIDASSHSPALRGSPVEGCSHVFVVAELLTDPVQGVSNPVHG